MYLVLSPSMSERGGSKDVKEFKHSGDLRVFLRSYKGSLARLEIFKAERLTIKLELQ